MAKYRQKTLWLSILFVLLVFTACDSAEDPTPTPIPPDEVSFQLNWVDTIEYSGFYMAEANGYYAEENISLELKPFDFAINPVEVVVSGEATFGTIGADKLLLARQAGQPIVAIATIYQRSPVAFVSLQASNISHLEDLIGKKVLISPGGTTDIIFQAMLESGDVSLSDIEVIPRTDFSNDALINGEADVIDVFINNQPIQLETEGHALNVFFAADYGVAIYANIIFTTEDMIANHPDVVQRFLRATLKGLQGAVDDPEKAAELAVARNEDLSLELETQSMFTSVPLITSRDKPPGLMIAEDWEIAHQILLDQGIMEAPLEVENAYTLQFLENIYPDSE